MKSPRGLLLGILLFGLLGGESAGQETQPQKIIRKITIRGLKRLSEASITAKMKIRIGQPYDENAVRVETGLLYKTGEFDQVADPIVQDFQDGVEIIFPVVERARIASVKLEARDVSSGKPSLSQKDLRDGIGTKPDGRLSEYSLRVDSDKIVRMYNEKGYPFTEVSTAVRDLANGVEVTFIINEGPRLRINQIDFVGNRSLDAGQLLRVMETTPKDILFFGLINPGYYDPEVLARDVGQITNFYASKGFFEARAAVEQLDFDPALERLRVVIRIEEGPRYTFRGYRFEGNRVFSTAVLEALTRAPVGQPYDEQRVLQDRMEIIKYYHDRAYIDAVVLPDKDYSEAGTEVQVVFKIEEGSEVYIEHVKIRRYQPPRPPPVPGALQPAVEGMRTQDRVVRRELEFYPGEKISFSKLEKSRSNLARLQIFRDVRIAFEPGSSPEKKDVVVQVEEEETTGQIMVGFGVTSGFGIIGNFSILKRNFDITDLPDSLYDLTDAFTGAGQTLNIVIQPGTDRSLYRGTFVEPYLFDTRNQLSLSGSIIKIIRDDYDEDRQSFIPRINHAFDFDRDLVFSVGSRIEGVDISDIDADAAPDVFEVKGHTTIIAATTGLTFDKILFDRLEGNYQGHRELLTYEYGGEPLGGQVDFHRVQGSLDLYFPIYVHEEGQLHHVIGLYSNAGVIEPHHSTDSIPIFERFFLGGPNTVRGFRFRGLGPQHGDDALGGTASWYGNVEYSFPLFQKFLRGVVFLDYGNLSEDLQSFELSQMRLAAGGGIRVNFPFIGGQPLPVGLYLGHAFKKEDFDRDRLFLFTIGVPF